MNADGERIEGFLLISDQKWRYLINASVFICSDQVTMRIVMRLAVLAWAILFQRSSGQKVKVPYGTEWQLGLSEYMCTIRSD